MQRGLLWFDDDPSRDLGAKVTRAARRYRAKFGMVPNACRVHPSALRGKGKTITVSGITVEGLSSVLRHHFWLGCEG